MHLFAGGTAFNAIAEELSSWTTNVAHVLPVSDNGGSTSEIVRVIGRGDLGPLPLRCLGTLTLICTRIFVKGCTAAGGTRAAFLQAGTWERLCRTISRANACVLPLLASYDSLRAPPTAALVIVPDGAHLLCSMPIASTGYAQGVLRLATSDHAACGCPTAALRSLWP